MFHDLPHRLAGIGAPQPGCVITAPGEHETAVRAKGSSSNPIIVLHDPPRCFAGIHPPQPGCFIHASCNHITTVGAKGYSQNTIIMMSYLSHRFTGIGAPQPGVIIASSEHETPVRAKSSVKHCGIMPVCGG